MKIYRSDQCKKQLRPDSVLHLSPKHHHFGKQIQCFQSRLNYRLLDLSSLKAFAVDNSYETENTEFVFQNGKNKVEGRTCWQNSIFVFFSNVSLKYFLNRSDDTFLQTCPNQKYFADDKLSLNKIIQFIFEIVGNIIGEKGENCGTQHFIICPKKF